jgi:hypothetical protein
MNVAAESAILALARLQLRSHTRPHVGGTDHCALPAEASSGAVTLATDARLSSGRRRSEHADSLESGTRVQRFLAASSCRVIS